ncbi:phosphate-starvation-inducible PsiE family protein [Enterococcus columbae]|uniref:Protein PsiE n=1 Tax=Enterococcus columbae DSM 7374 = ATCC 51263 TaxID=1121865 RepID=S0K728_9ENTE|nr:phosphate-starvation-inducible PsiE family protein [Enterococcus columbae]EOT40362.1 hypothetical protein OMW_01616 [Enterococcus columbae DSM 7374 = ATCC 51263]EOW84100.1 hypothetical protein I568_01259 [Enterococcus columbae DSM 7374 = ATCC 51263]OJG25372.1 hypothetical protein RR47_GL001817 [Enterococcus columbae DSM 7374 = ATCC 51263]
MKENQFEKMQKIVSTVVDILLGILVVIIIIVMGEALYSIVHEVIPLKSTESLYVLIEEVATLFILLEIILMLLRYVRDDHHIPVRYLVLISITAILRQLLLAHGGGLETLFLAGAILVLVIVLYILEHLRSFSKPEIVAKKVLEKIKAHEKEE